MVNFLPTISWPNRFWNANFPLYVSPSKRAFEKYKPQGSFFGILQYVKQTHSVLSTIVLPVMHTSSIFFVHLHVVYFASIIFCNWWYTTTDCSKYII